jgi:hypothetical protein
MSAESRRLSEIESDLETYEAFLRHGVNKLEDLRDLFVQQPVSISEFSRLYREVDKLKNLIGMAELYCPDEDDWQFYMRALDEKED